MDEIGQDPKLAPIRTDAGSIVIAATAFQVWLICAYVAESLVMWRWAGT